MNRPEVVLNQPGLTTARNGHSLTLNGRPVFSITKATSIIDKPGLRQWHADEAIGYLRTVLRAGTAYSPAELETHWRAAAGAAEAARTRATDSGANVANWIHAYIKAKLAGGPLPPRPAEAGAAAGCQGFQEWELEHRVRYLATEWSMASPSTCVGGRADTFALVDERPFIVDIKRVKPSKTGELRVYPEGELQVSGYTWIVDEAKLAPWAKRDEIGRALLAVSSVDGDHAWIEIETVLKDDWEALMAAARLRQRVPEWGRS